MKKVSIKYFIIEMINMGIVNDTISAANLPIEELEGELNYFNNSLIITDTKEKVTYKNVLILAAFFKFAQNARFENGYVIENGFYHHWINEWLGYKLATTMQLSEKEEEIIKNTVNLNLPYEKVNTGVANCDMPKMIFNKKIENHLLNIYNYSFIERDSLKQIPFNYIPTRNRIIECFDKAFDKYDGWEE